MLIPAISVSFINVINWEVLGIENAPLKSRILLFPRFLLGKAIFSQEQRMSIFQSFIITPNFKYEGSIVEYH